MFSVFPVVEVDEAALRCVSRRATRIWLDLQMLQLKLESLTISAEERRQLTAAAQTLEGAIRELRQVNELSPFRLAA